VSRLLRIPCLAPGAAICLAAALGAAASAAEAGGDAARSVSAAPSPVRFADVTRDSGIRFIHSFGDTRFSNLVEAVGGGAAWLDFDRDGWIDLYLGTGKHHPGLSEGGKPPGETLNRLYRNRGDGTFEDVTARARVGCPDCFTMGVTAGDYDNDGWTDLYLSNHGPNVLYRNLGDGTFADATRKAGVGDPGCSVASVWFDYDRDGWLDLYVGNYIEYDPSYHRFYPPDGFPGPLAYPPQKDSLYRNRRDGSFEEVSAKTGLTGSGRTMGAAAADLDGDGYPDLYVTNDATENFLYRNLGGKEFREVAPELGVAFNGMGDQVSSMAVDIGDVDGDGRADIFISDNSLSSLYRNDGRRFRDLTAESGIARASAQFVGWGAFLFDFDNDADLDVFKVNSDLSRLFGQEDQVFENLGRGRFQDVSQRMGPYFAEERMGRAAAFADFDNDGDPDVIVNNLGSPAVLLRNDGGNRNAWIRILLQGKSSNRDGVGARVTIVSGGRTQTTEKRSSTGYLGQNDPRLLFGLGQARGAERIEVVWPSGKTQVLTDVASGKTIVIEEPAR
jgi:hypothetical protein